MPVSRRQFVAWVSGAVPLVLVARRADALGARWLASDEATMRALAAAILPSELGATGVARVSAAFQRWIDDYRENVELVHGYGTSALRVTRASPRARWAAQLESLRRSGFNEKPVAQRRDAVRAMLATERADRMPDVAGAAHVALGLLAFYYSRSEAADLCYRAQIGRDTCRPLSQASRKPLPLAQGGAGGARR
jgi:hypothetical protein